MNTRTKAALLSVAAATTLVVAAAGPSGAAAGKSFAYGVSVNGQGQQPYVESTDGSTQTGGGAIPDDASPLLSGGVMKLTAGNDKASADLVDLGLLNIGDHLKPLTDNLKNLQPFCDGLGQAGQADQALTQINDGIHQAPGGSLITLPSVKQAQEFCNTVIAGNIGELVHLKALNVKCSGDTGTVNLAGAELLGAKVPGINGDVAPNTPLFPDNPGFNVILNRQTQNKDGSFTVDGLVVNLGGSQGADIVLASATCGKRIVDRTTNGKPPHSAPAPSPVHRSLGVTG